jgi:hypothetical protein
MSRNIRLSRRRGAGRPHFDQNRRHLPPLLELCFQAGELKLISTAALCLNALVQLSMDIQEGFQICH